MTHVILAQSTGSSTTTFIFLGLMIGAHSLGAMPLVLSGSPAALRRFLRAG